MTTNGKKPIRDPRFDPTGLYDRYRVKIKIRDRICGGMPKNEELIRAWVVATTGHDDEQTEEQVKENIETIVDKKAEKSWNGFPGDERGLFVPARNVKACFKQSASVLGIVKDRRGSKQILAEGMEVKALDGGDRIHLGRTEPDGFDESAIHVMTAQGPRSALRRMDYVEGVEIEFEVWVLQTHAAESRHIGEDELVDILRHAQENGLGASRSQGEGKFDVLEFEKLPASVSSAPRKRPPPKEEKPKKGKPAED